MTAAPHVKPLEATNKLILAALRAEPKENESNKFIGYCPVHETVHSNPSLLIYENASGYLGFSCLSRKCDGKEIIAQIKHKFGLSVPYPSKRIETGSGTVNKVVNYPAHEATLPLKYRKPDDIIYEYHCETGEVAFLVQRWINESGKKEIRPFFSKTFISDEGISQKDWDAVDPPKKDRPLYNLANLYKYSNKPVLIVEGEKAADAAIRMPELNNFVITTWSGGTGAHKFTNWKPLKDRETSIYFWPDNDASGTKAMREILAKLSSGYKDTRFYILDYKKIGVHEVAQGWDLADESASPDNPYSIEEMLEAFEPYSTDEVTEVGSLDDEMTRRDNAYRKLIMNGKVTIIDITKPNENEFYQHQWYKDVNALCAVDVAKIFPEDQEGRRKPVWLASHWYENYGTNNILHGLVFNPLSSDKIISSGPYSYLNTFAGFPDFGTNTSDSRLAQLFVEHITKLLEEPVIAEWLFDYFAHILQKPGEKPGVALIFEGGQATGKSSVHLMMSSVLGNHLSRVMDKGLSNWNGSLASSLMLVYDEFSLNMHNDKDRTYYNFLKNLITAPRVAIKEKYQSEIELDSFHRLVFTTNDTGAVNLPNDDRRFVIIRTTNHWHNNLEHFNKIRELLRSTSARAGFKHWLMSRKITNDVSMAPMTVAKEELLHSQSRVLDEVITWANGDGLPLFFRNILLPEEVQNFGNAHILIPRRLMREYFEKNSMRSYYDKTAIAFLKQVLPTERDHIKRRCVVLDYKGSVTQFQDLVYTIPPLQELRRNLEKITKHKIRWTEAEIEHPIEDDDRGNVVALAKRDSPV